MRELTPQERAVIFNALQDKARLDREAAESLIPAEGRRLQEILLAQANQADKLAELFL